MGWRKRSENCLPLWCGETFVIWAGVLWFSNAAFAQVPQYLSPEIKATPAIGSCPKDEPRIERDVYVRQRVEAEDTRSCMISADDLSRGLPGSALVIMDVRVPQAQGSNRIEGAIRISAAELAAKPYWRDKQVVLVGSGKSEANLNAFCEELKQAGYRHVQVLNGGMLQWLQMLSSTGSVSGSEELDLLAMGTLTAEELFFELQDPQALVIDARGLVADRIEIGAAVKVKSADLNAIEGIVSGRLGRKYGSKQPSRVLLLSRDISKEALRKIRRRFGALPVLVFYGPFDEVRRIAKSHQASLLAMARGPKRPGCGY